METQNEKRLTAIKAIRAKCLDCSGGSREEVKQCVIPDCPLYPFRLGKNPNIKRKEYTEEERKAMAETLAKRLGRKSAG